MITRKTFVPLLILAAIFAPGCRKSEMPATDDPATASLRSKVQQMSTLYNAVVQQARTNISVVVQILDCFPDTNLSISYFASDSQDPLVLLKGGLYQRYVLTVHVPIKLDEGRTAIVWVGEPAFDVQDVDSITRLADGRIAITHGSAHYRFGTSEWSRIFLV